MRHSVPLFVLGALASASRAIGSSAATGFFLSQSDAFAGFLVAAAFATVFFAALPRRPAALFLLLAAAILASRAGLLDRPWLLAGVVEACGTFAVLLALSRADSAAGAALGSLAGFAAGPLAPVEPLYVAAALLVLCSFLVPASAPEKRAAVPLNPYVRWIAAMSFFAVAAGAIAWCQFLNAARGGKDLAVLLGRFYGVAGAVQLAALPLRRFGVAAGLLVAPALFVAGTAAFLFHPAVWLAAIAPLLRLALDRPAGGPLFLPMAPALRARARAFLETIVAPLGLAAAAALLLAPAAFVAGVLWLAAAVWLVPQYRRALLASLGSVPWDVPDVAAALGERTAGEMLRSGEPERAAVALELWRDRPLGSLAPLVWDLVTSPSDEVAIRAVRLLGADGRPSHLGALRRAMVDARMEVRAAAILAHLQIGKDEAVPDVAPMLASEFDLVRIAVLVGCARHGGFDGALLAYPEIDRRLKSPKPDDRIEAIRVLVEIAGHGATREFVRLLSDPSAEVRREAVIAARALRDPGLFPRLMKMLDDRAVRPLVAQALEVLPPEDVPAVAAATRDRQRPVEERFVLARVLGAVGGLDAGPALWDLLAPDQDLHLRVEAARALRRLRSREGLHGFDLRGTGERIDRLRDEIALLRRGVAELDAKSLRRPLLADHVRTKRELLLSLLALDGDEEEVRRIEEGLLGEDPARRASALRLLAMEEERLVPLFEEDGASGAGLTEENYRRLLHADAWTRTVTMLDDDAPRIEITGGEAMENPETRLTRLLSVVSFLKQVDLFRDVPAHHLASLAEIVAPVHLCAGERLFAEGDPGDACFLVCEGKIRIRSGGADVATLGARECLGELALLDGQPRSATATAAEDARLLRISAEEFRNLVGTNSGIAVALLRTLARRLRESTTKYSTVRKEIGGKGQ
ncbi:MAG: HEAT repeat domain-containing protein [Planctomycetes bacterium]|nr:HEAT repeat domain-containing protein [Planctomycetota bacterium]